ncbi:RING-H2 finger protein ATL56-like [Panicum hallii]|uniref:RING-H2 finger protein ATL56-like n=1 Tax=Panicum hallii TaxID=206008 RepID=UPI000DF4E3A8|nr:RING-H2 finger protein ATL56-like [Panicum hallii]
MAPPAPAGARELVVPAAPARPEEPQAPPPPPHDRDVAKRGRPGPRPQGAGARILSLGVRAAVMAAAIAIFLLFAAASAVLLLVLVVAARAFRHHRGSRYRVPSPGPPSPLRAGLSPADLRRLPTFAFPSPPRGCDGTPSASPCAVCLEAARAGERWRAMPACRHAFHAACVDRWLARSPACPVCRAAVAVPAR